MTRTKLLFLLVMLMAVYGCPTKIRVEPETQQAVVKGSEDGNDSDTQQPQDEKRYESDIQDTAKVLSELQPVFFDYDRWEIRGDQILALKKNAQYFTQNPKIRLLIEGHCDERGTEEYNLALGEQRARAAGNYLISLGIPEEQLLTITYGENKPFEKGHDESAWGQNRRAHFLARKE